MTTIVSFNPNRAADLSGFAVPGALATFYDSGTSRERIVYSDPECTLPHPSPLAADGAGVFPAIYDTGDGDVKVEVTTPEGVMLAGYPMDGAGGGYRCSRRFGHPIRSDRGHSRDERAGGD